MTARLTGCLFAISRACVDDGPGLRTVAFLKGCRLDCPWCHNPEGKGFSEEEVRIPTKCCGCGACRTGGADACITGARAVLGKRRDLDEVLDELLLDEDFMKGTGGGVTFSGGEPLAQPEFLFAAAEALRARGVHVAVETSGFWSPKLVSRVAQHIDLVLFDLKHVLRDKARSALGVDYVPTALTNLRLLRQAAVPLSLRMTLVPGFNADPEDIAAVRSVLGALSAPMPDTLLGFHRLAVAKASRLGRPYPCAELRPLKDKELRARRLWLKAE